MKEIEVPVTSLRMPAARGARAPPRKVVIPPITQPHPMESKRALANLLLWGVSRNAFTMEMMRGNIIAATACSDMKKENSALEKVMPKSRALGDLRKSTRVRMASLVAEIPVYIQGTNPKSIEAVLRKLAAILGLRINLDRLRKATDAWEQRLADALENEQELSEFIHKLEHDYDNEVFDTQMGDLKEWLEQRGIRVD